MSRSRRTRPTSATTPTPSRRPSRGPPTAIAFNARYLIDVLSALGADEAALELSGPLAPGVIRGIGKDDYVHVIMPVRTAS